jgi:hypothetical protein
MMRRSFFPPLGALAAGMLLAATAAAQADRLIKEMSAYIGSAQEFTFHADVTFDHVLPWGQKLQFSAAEEVVLKRPRGLYVEWNGDLGARQFWYDGKSVNRRFPTKPTRRFAEIG